LIEQALITILVPITAACAFVIRGMWKTIVAEREELHRERRVHLRLLSKYQKMMNNHFKHDELYQKEMLENLKELNKHVRLW
jgi:hypothetical protein